MKNYIINFKKENSLYILIFIFISYRFIDSFFWYHPYDVSTDSDTHWAYLAATTFDFIDPKWDFPKFVYGPWYYFLTAYIFGPIFFSLYYIDIISVHEAAMYSFMFMNFTLSICLLIGTIKLSKKLFKNELGQKSYVILIMLLPFSNKAYYNFTVENLALAFMPWILIYLIKSLKKNLIKDWIKFSFLLAISATSKVNILIPNLLLISSFLFFHLVKYKKFNFKFFIPYLMTIVMIISSNLITKSSLFDKSSVGTGPDFTGIPNYSVFYKINFKDAYKNPLYPQQRNSWANMWSLDFFGDYFNSIKTRQRFIENSEDKIIKLNRNILILTLLFFSWYTFCLVKSFNRNLFSYENIYSIMFFAIFFEQFAYCYYVFNPELAQSFDMRYWVFYTFFLVYPLSKTFDKIKTTKHIKYNYYITIFFGLASLNQLLVIF